MPYSLKVMHDAYSGLCVFTQVHVSTNVPPAGKGSAHQLIQSSWSLHLVSLTPSGRIFEIMRNLC